MVFPYSSLMEEMIDSIEKKTIISSTQLIIDSLFQPRWKQIFSSWNRHVEKRQKERYNIHIYQNLPTPESFNDLMLKKSSNKIITLSHGF